MKINVKNVDISFYSNIKSSSIKRKRERRVDYYPDLKVHMKSWVEDWEHSKVTRYGFESGYYDSITVPYFKNIVTHNNKDLGYCIETGVVAGSTLDTWNFLIAEVGRNNLIVFFKLLIERGLSTGSIFTDLAPSNIIVKNNKPCLIDLEGLESFSWMFDGNPLPHEAQNRNLQKCDNPFWRGFDEYYHKFMKDVVGIENFNDKLNSVKSIKKMYTLL